MPYDNPHPHGRPASKPHIALISDHSDPAAMVGVGEAGGQNVYVRQVGEGLARLGWQVEMFTRKAHADDADTVTHLPNCRTIRLHAGPQHFVPRDDLFNLMPEFITAFKAFQAREGITYPLIHTHYWLSAWAGLQVKRTNPVRLVHTYHSVGIIKYQHTQPIPAVATARLETERHVLEQADCVVATSPQERAMMRSLLSEQGRVEVIPCGVDLISFYPEAKDEARATLHLEPMAPVVLFVGRFDPRKGIETLVRACALAQARAHPTLQLLIVGGSTPGGAEGQERQRIERLVEETGLTQQTRFAGRVGHDRLRLYYAAADLCVVPSHYEPFGMVALEAMACGTPVIASAVGGLTFTVLPEKTGLLVPPKDVEALAAAIERLLSSKAWARSLGAQGAATARRAFGWHIVTTRLSALYEALLQG